MSDDKIEWTKRLLRMVEEKYSPKYYCWLFSGGNDSLTVGCITKEVGRIDYAIHCDTGTAIPEVLLFCREHCIENNIPLIVERPKLKDTFETYVLEYGFPGKNNVQHFEMYKRLKDHSLQRAISQIRNGKNIGKVVLISGARKSESKRRMGTAVNIKEQGNIIWVNAINEWNAEDCIEYLESRNIKQSPVVKVLGRSGECNCGVYADRETELPLIKQHYPALYHTMMILENKVKEKFPWGWGEEVAHGWIEYQRGARFLPGLEPDWVNEMNMCTMCINRLNSDTTDERSVATNVK